MKERPILFSAPMVRALLAGTKTQTRRIVSPRHLKFLELPASEMIQRWGARPRPYGGVGDRLWVRETWGNTGAGVWTVADARSRLGGGETVYRADGERPGCGWFPSIHMPREFSRLLLEITEVRVQRLQEISYEDALAEGIIDGAAFCAQGDPERRHEFTGETSEETARRLEWPQRAYRNLWESINGAGSWDANAWVWAITFKRVQP